MSAPRTFEGAETRGNGYEQRRSAPSTPARAPEAPGWPARLDTVRVFSMSLAATSPLRKLLSSAQPAEAEGARAKALPLGLRQIDEALPDGGFPCGAVVEISSPYGLARATSLALAACASAQAEANLRGGEE